MKRPSTLFAASLAPAFLLSQAPVIHAVLPLESSVEQYGKFEAAIELTATYANPYDYDEIRVSAVFTGPGGQVKTVDGFFAQDYQFTNLQTGDIEPVGNGGFRLRFAPGQTGVWTYVVACTTAAGTGAFPPQTLLCSPPVSTANRGFVHASTTNYLHFDNGDQYIPVGENMAWPLNNVYQDYQSWLTQLRDHGGNYFRLWQTHWGLGLEWQDNGYPGLKRYKQDNSFYLDWLFDYSSANGLYLMWCQQHHGQVSTGVNPNWAENPYNTANGGPCADTWDFFTDPAAKALAKNRYRYVLARWGYARSIMAWELFNEVDWTDQFEQKKDDVAAWHAEMAAFFQEFDPYDHAVTTSYAHDFNDPQVWNQPGIDFTQTHHYSNSPNFERAVAAGVRQHLEEFEKPVLNSEFGLSGSADGLDLLDPDGIHLHNALWAGLFAGGMGSGMIWWWDSYVDPQNLYHHFGPVGAVAETIPLRAGNFQPSASSVTGVPSDLSLTPTLSGWGALADTAFTIGANGQLLPAGVMLGQILYGSAWNTQYRRPPTFDVNFLQAGQFRVQTSANAGQAPKIAIWLDGLKVFEQNALTGQTYSIDVPAGIHIIRVDNTGTDWIGIAGYVFTGLGSAIDSYVLKSDNHQQLAGWALNNRYNHDYIHQNGPPPPASGALLHVPNVINGAYYVKYYDCLTGDLLSSAPVLAQYGQLTLNLPDVLWDVAFVVDNLPVGVTEARRAVPVQVWPNPAPAGQALTVSFNTGKTSPVVLTLLDRSGRTLQTLYRGELPGGEQSLPVQLPAADPSGLYWIRVNAEGRNGTRAVMVSLP